jgi:hypothetical protein
MAKEKVKWKLGQQKNFGIEGIDRPNLREMQEYITGQDMMDFYGSASKEEIKAVNQLASSLIYGGKGSYISASQWDELLGSKDYQTKMRKVGSDIRKNANDSSRAAKLRNKAIGLQAQVNLPEGNLPQSFNQMPKSATPNRNQPSIADVKTEDETPSDGGMLSGSNESATFRPKRSLLGGM